MGDMWRYVCYQYDSLATMLSSRQAWHHGRMHRCHSSARLRSMSSSCLFLSWQLSGCYDKLGRVFWMGYIFRISCGMHSLAEKVRQPCMGASLQTLIRMVLLKQPLFLALGFILSEKQYVEYWFVSDWPQLQLWPRPDPTPLDERANRVSCFRRSSSCFWRSSSCGGLTASCTIEQRGVGLY